MIASMLSSTHPQAFLRLGALCALLTTGAAEASAQTRLPLWPEGAPGAVADSAADRPTLTRYAPPPSQASGAAVVIFPGGGYRHLAVEKEGTWVAEWLAALGVTAVVVEYRLGPRYRHPAMLDDAQRAVRTVRANAEAWGIDPDRVALIGFSAGGHLAATVATEAGAARPGHPDPVERQSAAADLLLLLYPVVSLRDPWAHAGSRRYLLGDAPPPGPVAAFSNEARVTGAVPPTFVVSSTDDAVVPVENSLLFYGALRAAGVPAELHLFETAPHGFGPRPADPAVALWTRLAEEWLRRHGWLDAAP
jgi:acetyl esterase/lipase